MHFSTFFSFPSLFKLAPSLWNSFGNLSSQVFYGTIVSVPEIKWLWKIVKCLRGHFKRNGLQELHRWSPLWLRWPVSLIPQLCHPRHWSISRSHHLLHLPQWRERLTHQLCKLHPRWIVACPKKFRWRLKTSASVGRGLYGGGNYTDGWGFSWGCRSCWSTEGDDWYH